MRILGIVRLRLSGWLRGQPLIDDRQLNGPGGEDEISCDF
jgi:hypothetical protein